MAFLPQQADFIPVSIKLDPLDKSLVHRGFFLGDAERL